MTQTPREPGTAVLPPRARLLHIGIPKSGTTTLQRAAAQNRRELLAHGVRYPGRQVNHRREISALMGRRLGWSDEDARQPPIVAWERLMREIGSDPDRRIFLSHESASECTDEQAARFGEQLGPDLHVVVTLRSFAAILASNWQQYVRSGVRRSFDSWLRAVLADPPVERVTPGFHMRADQGALVLRWAKVVGPERLIVIIGDKSNYDFLTDAFADLLGLPHELLRIERGVGGYQTNRSLSLPEVELFRAMNALVRIDDGLNWKEFSTMVRGGAIARLQEMRVPPPDEPSVLLPQWAADRAEPRARAHAAAIEDVGCRVIGDLKTLFAPVPTCPRVPTIDTVPIEAAAQALAGMSLAAADKPFDGRFLDLPASGTVELEDPSPRTGGRDALTRLVGAQRREDWMAAYSSTSSVPTSHLLAVAAMRQARSARLAVRRAASRVRR